MEGPIYLPDRGALDNDLKQILNDLEESEDLSKDLSYMPTLKAGLKLLMSLDKIPADQAWKDGIQYARAVITSPRDDWSRLNASWSRSSSKLTQTLLGKFGPSTILAASEGCTSIVIDHFGGKRSRIAHVDKEANFMRHWRSHTVGEAFCSSPSILGTFTYDSGTLVCALTHLAWTTPEEASKLGTLAHLAVCDNYPKFTGSEYEVRMRMVALAMGSAYQHGRRSVNALVDGSLFHSSGTGSDLSIDSVMAWRAVSGCATHCSGYVLGVSDVEQGSVAPQIMMATHDLFDWRSDTAAGNHENGVSAIYGLGVKDPFHTYLEAILCKAVEQQTVAAMHAVAAITFMHFTAARYGAYCYRGSHKPSCTVCVELLRQGTAGAQLKWLPTPPPDSFEEGHDMRKLSKLLIDRYEDHGLVQVGASWFQFLVITGEIWMFDLLAPGVKHIDDGTSWD